MMSRVYMCVSVCCVCVWVLRFLWFLFYVILEFLVFLLQYCFRLRASPLAVREKKNALWSPPIRSYSLPFPFPFLLLHFRYASISASVPIEAAINIRVLAVKFVTVIDNWLSVIVTATDISLHFRSLQCVSVCVM